MKLPINKDVTKGLIVFLCVLIQSVSGLRILGLFPLQVRSHYVMCEELMKGLAAKGHQVDVYSHFPQKKTIPNFKDISLKGTLPAISNNMSFDMSTTTWAPTLMKNWQQGVGKPVCDLMGHPILQQVLHNPPKDPPYDLIITEVKYLMLTIGKTLLILTSIQDSCYELLRSMGTTHEFTSGRCRYS